MVVCEATGLGRPDPSVGLGPSAAAEQSTPRCREELAHERRGRVRDLPPHRVRAGQCVRRQYPLAPSTVRIPFRGEQIVKGLR